MGKFYYDISARRQIAPTIKADAFSTENASAFNLFGEPNVNYPNTIMVVKNGFGFVLNI